MRDRSFPVGKRTIRVVERSHAVRDRSFPVGKRTIRVVERTDADRYRLAQAEQLLREAGFEPDEQGHWHLVSEPEPETQSAETDQSE